MIYDDGDGNVYGAYCYSLLVILALSLIIITINSLSSSNLCHTYHYRHVSY